MKGVVLLGYLLGIALPVLETNRRGFGHWLVNATTMVDDYIMGAVLLTACLSWSLNNRAIYLTQPAQDVVVCGVRGVSTHFG